MCMTLLGVIPMVGVVPVETKNIKPAHVAVATQGHR